MEYLILRDEELITDQFTTLEEALTAVHEYVVARWYKNDEVRTNELVIHRVDEDDNLMEVITDFGFDEYDCLESEKSGHVETMTNREFMSWAYPSLFR